MNLSALWEQTGDLEGTQAQGGTCKFSFEPSCLEAGVLIAAPLHLKTITWNTENENLIMFIIYFQLFAYIFDQVLAIVIILIYLN